jgi:hypothetical protein
VSKRRGDQGPYAPPRARDGARDPPARRSKRTFWGCLIAAIVGLLATCGYPPAKMYWSRTQVKRFCDQVKIGQPTDGLAARAREMWLQVREYELRGRDPTISVWEGWVFARTFCDVSHRDGKVTDKRLFSLD